MRYRLGLICWRYTKDKYYQYKYTHKKYLLLLIGILFILSICELILDLIGKLMSTIYQTLKEESEYARHRRYEEMKRNEHLRLVRDESIASQDGARISNIRYRNQVQEARTRQKNFNRFMYGR